MDGAGCSRVFYFYNVLFHCFFNTISIYIIITKIPNAAFSLWNNCFFDNPIGAFLPFPLDFSTTAQIDVFPQFVFLKFKGLGRVGVKGGVD
jgi:hypothetical protein